MGFNKIVAVSMTDLFVQQIENMILSGELAIGEQLPPARELSVKMGVSRTVISAGLVELEKLGFVEIRTRQGVFVCDYRRKGSLETLIAIMRYNGVFDAEDEFAAVLAGEEVVVKGGTHTADMQGPSGARGETHPDFAIVHCNNCNKRVVVFGAKLQNVKRWAKSPARFFRQYK